MGRELCSAMDACIIKKVLLIKLPSFFFFLSLFGFLSLGFSLFPCFSRALTTPPLFSLSSLLSPLSSFLSLGRGISGNKGRCYDFWIDFSECMSRCREPKDCSLLREDYLECLHHSKEFQRRNRVYKEEQRQIRAAARKAKGEDDNEIRH